jgi:hypothetical protein
MSSDSDEARRVQALADEVFGMLERRNPTSRETVLALAQLILKLRDIEPDTLAILNEVFGADAEKLEKLKWH